MKDIIINQPHLQSFQQKCGSVFMSLLSWVLWLYFLWPLFTLGGWLMGLKSLSDDIRWFGGYKTLLELLQLYGEIVMVIAGIWLFWTIYLSWLHARVSPKRTAPVTDRQLAVAFRVGEDMLAVARASKKVTVHFNTHAVITDIDSP
ncbi:MAG: poly-beta-1,6-N-acetyl-D-glucosamine biosynthesis protein PgaD [Proteobacteria bacterium ST_bin11]|jgi:poly-beta-1,6-N-acetyl-D-glucosamine biosynthesis protein PgaD|nr:MAG: poly-beta-1,6-N-acetyl-D-glucosamine biosynthesis protein PgaD [Proteobacteria bacterium ST_bin11]